MSSGDHVDGGDSKDPGNLWNRMPLAGGGRISGRGLSSASNEAVVIDLGDDDDEENPTPHLTINGNGLTGSSSSPIQCLPGYNASVLYQMTLKLRRNYEAQNTRNEEKIKRLENQNHTLIATLQDVMLEKKELGRRLKSEEDKVSSLKNGIAMMEEQIREVNLVFGGMASRLKTSVAAELDCIQPPFPVASQNEITTTEIKMEPVDTNYVDEEDPMYYQVPGPSTAVTFHAENEVQGCESVPVVCGMVMEERPISPPPSAFPWNNDTSNCQDRRQKRRKLLHKYKKVRQPPPTARVKVKPYKSGINQERKKSKKGVNLKDDGLVSLVYGRKRDRRLFGLRPSSAPRRKLVDQGCSRPRQIYPQEVRGKNNENGSGQHTPPPKPQRPRLYRNSEAAKSSTHAKDISRSAEGGHFCCCGQSYKTQTSLNQHVRYFGEEWKFKCQDCGKRFFNTFNLRNHLLKVHQRILPTSSRGCFKCGRVFESHQDYYFHLKLKTC